MSAGHHRYIATEMAVSAGINAVLSLAFGLLIFHGQTRIGAAPLVADAVPQSFVVTLMSTIVPTLITRKRLRAGAIMPREPGGLSLPQRLVVRALVIAVPVTLLAWLCHKLLLPGLLPDGVAFGPMLAAKTLYGAVLGAVMTLIAVRSALADRRSIVAQ